MFGYQKVWYQAGLQHTERNLLKSRQIGATFYFAREALIDALTTGRNQIFLSASKAQAHQFKQYILAFAQEVGVELKGDPITLGNGAIIYFLGTNSRTAQSYHGNLYIDEYFWIPKFQELYKVSSGMAMQKFWRLTYFSTPSSLSHDAYPFWSGAMFNKGRPKNEHIKFDVEHAALHGGRLCGDGQWRQIVTVEDAVRGGCDLFDLDRLRRRYSPDDYNQLLMCQFADDTDSEFPLAMLQRCMVDSWEVWEVWEDYKPHAMRPLGHRSVWIGYDPAKGGQGDSAGSAGGTWRQVSGARAPPLERDGLRRPGAGHQGHVRALQRGLYRHRHDRDRGGGLSAGEAVLPGSYPYPVQPECENSDGDEGTGCDEQGPVGV